MSILTGILITAGILNVGADIIDEIYLKKHDWENDIGYQQWKTLHENDGED